MTHEDAGHYAKKHPEGTTLQPEIAEALKSKQTDGKISCAAAHAVADQLNISPAEVGITIDLMEYRLLKCQLGMYGYDAEKPITIPLKDSFPQLEEKIRQAAVNNRISCKACWDIADASGEKRLTAAKICESLKIKISPCQLGAF